MSIVPTEYTKLDPAVKGRWVAALRSGSYQQGKNALRRIDDRFCCLGVLCDLHLQEHGGKWRDMGERYSVSSHTSAPPPEVWEWAGMTSMQEDLEWELMRLNDEEGYTFEQIAEYIEANA